MNKPDPVMPPPDRADPRTFNRLVNALLEARGVVRTLLRTCESLGSYGYAQPPHISRGVNVGCSFLGQTHDLTRLAVFDVDGTDVKVVDVEGLTRLVIEPKGECRLTITLHSFQVVKLADELLKMKAAQDAAYAASRVSRW